MQQLQALNSSLETLAAIGAELGGYDVTDSRALLISAAGLAPYGLVTRLSLDVSCASFSDPGLGSNLTVGASETLTKFSFVSSSQALTRKESLSTTAMTALPTSAKSPSSRTRFVT